MNSNTLSILYLLESLKKPENKASVTAPIKEETKVEEPNIEVEKVEVKEENKPEEKKDMKEAKDIASLADMGHAPECPDCGNMLEFSEGCMLCRSCGYSKCG